MIWVLESWAHSNQSPTLNVRSLGLNVYVLRIDQGLTYTYRIIEFVLDFILLIFWTSFSFLAKVSKKVYYIQIMQRGTCSKGARQTRKAYSPGQALLHFCYWNHHLNVQLFFFFFQSDESIYERECGNKPGFAVYYRYPNSQRVTYGQFIKVSSFSQRSI